MNRSAKQSGLGIFVDRGEGLVGDWILCPYIMGGSGFMEIWTDLLAGKEGTRE